MSLCNFQHFPPSLIIKEDTEVTKNLLKCKHRNTVHTVMTLILVRLLRRLRKVQEPHIALFFITPRANYDSFESFLQTIARNPAS